MGWAGLCAGAGAGEQARPQLSSLAPEPGVWVGGEGGIFIRAEAHVSSVPFSDESFNPGEEEEDVAEE